MVFGYSGYTHSKGCRLKSLNGTVDLPPSQSIAERALRWGILQRREVILKNATALVASPAVVDLISTTGFELRYNDDIIEMRRAENVRENTSISPDNMDSFLQHLVAFAPNGEDVVIHKPEDSDDDHETRLLLFRRMGIDYDRVEDEDITMCRPTLNPPESIRYTLPERNYHLVESLSEGVLTSGCQVDLCSPIGMEKPLMSTFSSLGLSFEQVIEEGEEDELERRLKRLKPKEIEREFVYRISRNSDPTPIEMTLPGDFELALFLASAVLSRKKSSVVIRGLLKSTSIISAFRLFGKAGADVSVTDGDSSELPLCNITVGRSGDLAGKRFGGDSIRALPEVAIPLAVMGMFASGKTVIRDLPFGSVEWQRRVSNVREILDSCGARVGEIEDGLVVEAAPEYSMTRYIETGDPLCELLQQTLSLVLEHDSGFTIPENFNESHLYERFSSLSKR